MRDRVGVAVMASLLSACAAPATTPSHTALPDTTVTVTAAAVTVTVHPADPPPQPPAGTGLADLVVREWDNPAGYGRYQFGQAWSDDVTLPSGHNGCDQRNDVLRRDLRDASIKPGTRGCVVLSGVLSDPYTGAAIAYIRGATPQAVQIDHIVSLSNAWVTGAQDLTDQERRNLAGDPLNLWAVSAHANETKKDSDAASWLPELPTARCGYIARQIEVKAKYRLWVTAREKQSMNDVLRGCPGQGTPAAIYPPPPHP